MMVASTDNRTLFLMAVLLGLCCSVASQKKPHIILIMADDLGWDDVSFHGSTQIPTPFIDNLANRGVILNNYYVSPICTPSRASIMTGKYPIHLGMQHFVIFAAQPSGLPLDEITLPQYLKVQGYKTRGVGKWHLGFFIKEYTPVYRGFDSFYGFWEAKTDYWNHSSYENEFWGIDMRDDKKVVNSDKGVYGTELFTREAVKVIDNHDVSKPLFLYVAHQAPHSANPNMPLQAPQDKVDKFASTIDKHERQVYAAMVTCVDESVGSIYKALKSRNMLKDSVIIFTTDNGGAPYGFNWNMGSNYPLRGGKDMLWEGGVRGTAFVYSDLIKHKGRVSNDLIDITDWVPTIYHLAGGTSDYLEPNMDGKNVWQTISEKKPSPRKEVLHNIDPWRNFSAIRMDQYKLVVGQDDTYQVGWHPRYKGQNLSIIQKPKTLPGAIVDCGSFQNTSMCNSKNGAACLFDIHKDPCEYHDLSKDLPKVVARLQKRLMEFRKTMLNVWYPPIDNAANPAKFNGFWSSWRQLNDNISVVNVQEDLKILASLESNSNGVSQQDQERPGNQTIWFTEYELELENRTQSLEKWTPHKPVDDRKSEQPTGAKDRFYYHKFD